MDINIEISVNGTRLITLDALGLDTTDMADLNVPYAVFATSEGNTVAFGTIECCRKCGTLEIIRQLVAFVDPDVMERQAKGMYAARQAAEIHAKAEARKAVRA